MTDYAEGVLGFEEREKQRFSRALSLSFRYWRVLVYITDAPQEGHFVAPAGILAPQERQVFIEPVPIVPVPMEPIAASGVFGRV